MSKIAQNDLMMHFNPISDLEKRAESAGISISELCQKANVARSTFTRWKNGTSSPTLSIIAKLESALVNKNKRKHSASHTGVDLSVNK